MTNVPWASPGFTGQSRYPTIPPARPRLIVMSQPFPSVPPSNRFVTFLLITRQPTYVHPVQALEDLPFNNCRYWGTPNLSRCSFSVITSHCPQDRPRFVLGYPRLTRFSKLGGFGLSHWPLGDSFDWHASLRDGTQSTSAAWHVHLQCASYPWSRQDPLC